MNILPLAVALTAPQRNQATIIEALIPTMLPINPDQLAMFTAFSANEQATRAQINQAQAVRSVAVEVLQAAEEATASQVPLDPVDVAARFPNVGRLNLVDRIVQLGPQVQ